MENINDYMPLSNDWNKERLETLKKMFPDLFTNEGKLNINELKKVVDPESISETERYEFRWFGKSAAKRKAFSPSNATLVFDEKRSVNASETENLIIEGENLEVLKLLSTAYREKVKCIYIDPPYNTGKDFVYSDNYSQDKKGYWEDAGVTEEGLKIDTNTETDGRYHSNWLNMMYSRLLIARQLLREDGVIFISIDDNEIINLSKVLNEVFGEENYVGTFIWRKKEGGGQTDDFFVREHEYIVVYRKSESFIWRDEELFNSDTSFNKEDEKGKYKAVKLAKWGTGARKEDRPTMHFPIKDPNEKNVYPVAPDGNPGRWRIGKSRMQNLIENELIHWEEKNGNFIPYEKVYYDENEVKVIKDRSIIFDETSTAEGTNALTDLFGVKDIFENPKPPQLIQFLIRNNTDAGDLILDFFGGSGSTGHAIFSQNITDKKDRQFILVQFPERTTEKSEAFKAGYKKISDITIERNKRVVERIIEEKKKEQPDLFTNGHKEDAIKGLGFKVFKLVKSNFPRVEFAPDPEKTTEENIELLKKYIRDKEAQLITAFNRDELVTEILIKNGFTLNYTLTKQEEFKKNEIFFATDGEKETLICLDISIDMETVEHFKKHNTQKFICLERALDTTKKWNLKHYLGDKFNAF